MSVSIARQLQAFGDPRLSDQLEKVWGKFQPTSRAKSGLLAKYKALLASDSEQPADLSRGRAVFNRTCLACHGLYDSGGDVGPDLTDSDRANVDYISRFHGPGVTGKREAVIGSARLREPRLRL